MTGHRLHVIISAMIRVIVDGKEQILDKRRVRIEVLLKRLQLNPETALALRGGSLLTEDEDLEEGDTCIIMRTVAER